MKTLQERLAGFEKQTYTRVPRNDMSYSETLTLTVAEIERLLCMYRAGGNRQYLRLLRDSIDHWLRRFHGYNIGGRIGTHYQSREAVGTIGIFEHVIPAKDLRDMMLAGSLSITEALHAPICRITAEQDQQLRSAGLVSSTPDHWHFFARYAVLATEFYRCNDANPISTATYTLANHYEYFLPATS